MTRPVQLIFNLAGHPALAEDDFLPAESNQEALAWVCGWPSWPGFGLAVWGPEGSGKSHLASILARRAVGRVVAASRLTAESVPELAESALIAVEDADRGHDEAALLHLHNLVREKEGFLLLTGRTPPARWDVKLPDLRSRLAALPSVALGVPDDALLKALLVKLFADRRLAVSGDVISILFARMERTAAAARALVWEIDDAAMLVRRRQVSATLAREVLADMERRG